MLDSLSMFTRFIPGLNNLVDSAREKIAGMIDSVQIEKDTLATERALRDVKEALDDTTEVIDNHAESTEIDTLALQTNREELELQEAQLQKQLEAYESLAQTIEETRKQFEYERSEAGKLGITLRNVTYTLFGLGYSNDEIVQKLSQLGEKGDDVNAVMNAFGLTTEVVTGFLEKQKDAIDKTTEAYKEQADAAAESAYQQARAARAAGYTGSSAGFGAGIIEAGMSAYQKAYALGLSEEEYERRYGSYQRGGPIIEPTLLYGLRSLKPYAVAHEGEKVISSVGQQMMTFILQLDGRQLANILMPYQVGEIRLRTGLKL